MVDIQAGFRIVRGHVSRAQLYLDGALIEGLPVQADRRPWYRPGNVADVVAPATFEESISGRRDAYGPLEFTWPLQGLAPTQVAYLFTVLFESAYHGDFTVQTFNRSTGTWEAYQVIGNWPDVRIEAELAGAGFDQFKVSFDGEPAPEGPDVVPALTTATPTITVDDEVTLELVVTNAGDADTFEAVVALYAVPDEFDLVSVAGTGWAVEYSTDGVVFDATPPGDLTTVTHVRATHAGVIASGDDSAALALVLAPNSADVAIEHTVAVSTAGDTDTDNDSDAVTVTVQPAPDLALGVDYSATTGLVIATPYTWTASVENLGGDTYADVVIEWALPAELHLVSAAGTGWAVEYSTDGVVFDATPPGDLTTVTHIEVTRAAVAAAATAPDLVVTFTPNTDGTFDNTVTVATTGDSNAANDTSVQSLTVTP